MRRIASLGVAVRGVELLLSVAQNNEVGVLIVNSRTMAVVRGAALRAAGLGDAWRSAALRRKASSRYAMQCVARRCLDLSNVAQKE